ncbi:MAG: hypothetical protein V3T05_04880 [Myxococcota bacterium]
MFYTYIAVAAVALSSSSSSNIRETVAPPATSWIGTVQLGVGRVGEDGALLLKPRLIYLGDHGELMLSAPLWLEVADLPPRRPGRATTREPRWLLRWDDPATYLGWIERLAWTSSGGKVGFTVGSLAQETLGHGAIVDRFVSSLDPLRLRTGGRVDIDLGMVQASVLADSFVQPNMIGAAVRVAPLAIAGWDPERRWTLVADAAVDPRAPSSAGRRAIGGGSVGLSAAIWRYGNMGVELFALGGFLSKPAWGTHVGAVLEWSDDGRPHANAFSLRLEGFGAGVGYVPAYFDGAYSFERYAFPAGGRLPKADERRAGSLGLRADLDARIGVARFGITATHLGAGRPGRGAIYARIVHPRWSAAATVMQLSVSRARDLWHGGGSTYAMLEASALVRGGLFVFAHTRHGPRWRPGGLPRPVTDWLAGVGYGARDGG